MFSLIKFQFIAVWVIFLISLSPSALASNTQQDGQALINQLDQHPSPYLALHGKDPVAWQDWGPEVLERAKRENKLILISSGYFSCHWCHVMQRESFQNPAIGEMLSNFYIPVKIDRELEPALDKRLMNYAQATLQRGGWPLNVFVSPDGLPVFATLYQPQLEFMALLTRLTAVWGEQSERIRELARAEKTPVKFADAKAELDIDWTRELHAHAIKNIMAQGDDLQGGFGASNKFPSAPQLQFLLDSLSDNRNPEIVEFLDLTLAAMANIGMRDQLGGGFYRYVVDPGWEIPHFEKMLYDNANLALLYLKAGEVLDKPVYTAVARDTLDFLLGEMAQEDGALYASFSAIDDKDIEGGYYLWTSAQLQAILNTEEYSIFSHTWQTERPEELEGGNHLRSAIPIEETALTLGISEQKTRTLLETARQKLLAERKKRELPTDDKLLAGWNGLALTAFASAAKGLQDQRYRSQAENIQHFIKSRLWNGEYLVRSLAGGQSIGSAAIEDYAYVSQGLYHWALLSGETGDFQLAEDVLTQGWKRFYHNNAWSYADNSLLPPADGKEMLSENSSASPSALLIQTTIMMHNTGKLQDQGLYPTALSALNRGGSLLRQNPFWYASQIGAMQLVKQ